MCGLWFTLSTGLYSVHACSARGHYSAALRLSMLSSGLLRRFMAKQSNLARSATMLSGFYQACYAAVRTCYKNIHALPQWVQNKKTTPLVRTIEKGAVLLKPMYCISIAELYTPTLVSSPSVAQRVSGKKGRKDHEY